MAKKRINISLEDVTKLAGLQCTEKEAAAFFGCSKKKFEEILETMPEVAEAWERGREGGKISIRRKQFALAAHSAPMAIFLGKQFLQQKDISTNEVTGKDGGPVETVDLTTLSQDERNKLRQILTKAKPE